VKCAEGYAETSSLIAAARMKVVAQKCCVFFISSRVKPLSCKLQFTFMCLCCAVCSFVHSQFRYVPGWVLRVTGVHLKLL